MTSISIKPHGTQPKSNWQSLRAIVCFYLHNEMRLITPPAIRIVTVLQPIYRHLQQAGFTVPTVLLVSHTLAYS